MKTLSETSKTIPKFECQHCGNCCRSWGNPDPKAIIETPSFVGEVGSVLLQMETAKSLLLYDWEINLFPKELIHPYLVFFDIKHERTITLRYCLVTQPCPHLDKNNHCKIYEQRPIACKVFPCPYANAEEMMQAGLTNPAGICKGELPFKELLKSLGGVFEGNGVKINNRVLTKRLYARYGDAVLYKNAGLCLSQAETEFLVNQERAGEMKFARYGYNLKHLQRRMSNGSQIPISTLWEQKTGEAPLKIFFTPPFLNELRKALQD